MVKSSVKIKYLSTCHPNFRDGLLKGSLENINEENDSIFHDSPATYYENRPMNKGEEDYGEDDEEDENNFDSTEMQEGFWAKLTFSEFMSQYDVIYAKQRPPNCHKLRNKNVYQKKNKASSFTILSTL